MSLAHSAPEPDWFVGRSRTQPTQQHILHIFGYRTSRVGAREVLNLTNINHNNTHYEYNYPYP